MQEKKLFLVQEAYQYTCYTPLSPSFVLPIVIKIYTNAQTKLAFQQLHASDK